MSGGSMGSINVGVGGGGVGAAGGGGSGSGSGGGGCGPCGACKFLRRKCVSGCIFAPYFDSEQGAVHFAAVHKVFGASNVSKLLLHIPTHKRLDAVITICYEANARLREPVYGCVAHIFALQQQVANLQAELSYMRAHLATLELPSPPLLPPPSPPPFSISELPSASSLPAVSFDIATLLEAPADAPWSVQQQLEEQQQMDLRQLGAGGAGGLTGDSSASGDLRALARELVDEHRSDSVDPPPLVSK